MFSDVFERFIQNRPIAVMVRVLLESWLNADQLDRWFDTVRQSQYTKDLLFSSGVTSRARPWFRRRGEAGRVGVGLDSGHRAGSFRVGCNGS